MKVMIAQNLFGLEDCSLVRLFLLVQLVWCCALAPVWGAGQASGSPREYGTLTFGVYAHVRSTELLKKFAPIRQYIEASMAKTGVARRIEMRIYPTYGEAIDALADGQVDFVRYGPVSYVLAKRRNPAIRLLAMESNHGEKRFSGVIFVSQDSQIHSVAQLRGRHIAFGSRMSTTGRYLAQAELVKAGIRASDLGDYSYLGRHDKVAFAVAAGQFDAGAMNENTFAEHAQSKGLRKILDFPCVTKPWVTREGLPDDVFFALRAALMKLDDPSTLEAIKRTGFLPASDSDYDLVREGMDLACEFELLTLRFGAFAQYGAGRGLRAIYRVPVPHKTWVVREGIDPVLEESLRSGLLAVRSPNALPGFQWSGFKQMDETVFESVNRAMESAGRF